MKKYFIFLLILLIIFSSTMFVACKNENEHENKDTSFEVVDMLNRKVLIKNEVNRVVCIGASALRLYTYVGDIEKLVGVEDFEKGQKMPARPYSHAYKEDFLSLPSCGQGGPSSSYDLEKILLCNPDIVLSLYNDVEAMNELQEKLNIPVVCFSYGNADPFSKETIDSIKLMGKVLNKENRANEVAEFINICKIDINNRVENVLDENKPTVFAGCNTYYGQGAFGASMVNYAPFRELKAKNILSNGNFQANNVNVNNEFILTQNPDYFFLDVINKNTFLNEYNKDVDNFVKDLKCVKNNNVYMVLPFNQYYTNIEVVIANTYFIGKTIYKEEFEDVDPIEIYNEICKVLLVKDIDYYSKMLENTSNFGYEKLNLFSN